MPCCRTTASKDVKVKRDLWIEIFDMAGWQDMLGKITWQWGRGGRKTDQDYAGEIYKKVQIKISFCSLSIFLQWQHHLHWCSFIEYTPLLLHEGVFLLAVANLPSPISAFSPCVTCYLWFRTLLHVVTLCYLNHHIQHTACWDYRTSAAVSFDSLLIYHHNN